MNKTIREQIEDIFASHMGADALETAKRGEKVFYKHEDTDKPGDPNTYCDSLDFIELIMVIEEHFGLEIPDKDAEALISLDAIENYIKTRATSGQ